MKCAVCKSDDHKVVETVEVYSQGEAIRRRRRCCRCGHRWTTYERDEAAIALIDTKAAGEHLDALQRLLAPTL